jgi:DNA polymerase-3 subunit alpha
MSGRRKSSRHLKIDTDFEGERRDDVKRYMEKRYGENYVCSVGTYTSLQLKQALKDLGKAKGVSFTSMNYLTQTLEFQDYNWKDIFRTAVKRTVWKEFVQKQTDLINDIPLCLHQPKATSIHPCATIILPKENNKGEEISIFNQIPVRKVGGVLVSEWEGNELADAGYLKEDILGIKQLDKFKAILNLIKETTGEDIDIYTLPLNIKGVYDLFKGGYNSDCFHFGSTMLKAYSREVLPDDIEELIAMIALVRPGATQSGAQYDYVNYKTGKKQPEYDFGLKEITKNTYGLYIYQEQIMQICQVLGGFTLSEAEDVRKSMGKLRRDLLEPFENKFIEGATAKNCNSKEAKKIWDKMVGFADYGFNRAHAASYAIMGYISQWLKYKYPLHFWTVAFQYADEDKIISYVSEINKTDDFIKIVPPDINNSRDMFYTDFKLGKIYWSLIKIHSLGPIAVKEIMEERAKNGSYFSLEEFYKRVAKNKVNKGIVENLILSGSFDDIEDIKIPQERLDLIFKYYDIAGVKEKDYNLLFIEEGIEKEYWWTLRQKEASGLGYFDYKKIISESSLQHLTKIYCDENNFFNTYSENKRVIIGGIILEVLERNSKQGKFAQITIDCNNELILINYWSKLWLKEKKRFDDSTGKILLISGRITYNSFAKCNTLQIEDNVELEILC